MSNTDKWARAIAVLSLLVSCGTLFFSTFEPASIRVGVGRHMLVTGRPRIGVLCTLVNNGARSAIMQSGTLQWDNPAAEFQLTMVSTKLEEWTYDESGQQKDTSPTTFTLVSPIAIKGRDQATAILWFTANTSFVYSPGEHKLLLKLDGGADGMWQTKLAATLSTDDVRTAKNPNSLVPIRVSVE